MCWDPSVLVKQLLPKKKNIVSLKSVLINIKVSFGP